MKDAESLYFLHTNTLHQFAEDASNYAESVMGMLKRKYDDKHSVKCSDIYNMVVRFLRLSFDQMETRRVKRGLHVVAEGEFVMSVDRIDDDETGS